MTATGPSVPVTAPVTLPPDFTIHNIAALVRDVAIQLEDMPAILKKHGLSQLQYDSLANNQFFQHVLQDAIKNWHAPQSTKERVALAAAIALEDALPKIAARMTAGREDLADVVETAKLFADLAGMGPKAAPTTTAPGEKFSININLGGDVQTITTTRPVEGGPDALQIDAKAPANRAALRPILEGEKGAVEIRALFDGAAAPTPGERFPDGPETETTVERDTPPPEGRVETGF